MNSLSLKTPRTKSILPLKNDMFMFMFNCFLNGWSITLQLM